MSSEHATYRITYTWNGMKRHDFVKGNLQASRRFAEIYVKHKDATVTRVDVDQLNKGGCGNHGET